MFFVYIQKAYSAAWDKIKAKSYNIPHDSHALVHAKQQKVILSNVSPFSSPFSSTYLYLHIEGTAWVSLNILAVKPSLFFAG